MKKIAMALLGAALSLPVFAGQAAPATPADNSANQSQTTTKSTTKHTRKHTRKQKNVNGKHQSTESNTTQSKSSNSSK